jgi:acetyl esterase/lipase
MLHKTINFTNDGRVKMRTYIHDVSDNDMSKDESWNPEKRPFNGFQISGRPAIVILPGGGFSILSDRESEPVALTFLKEGFNTFTLNYSIKEDSIYPNPLEDISRAVWEVRKNASEWDTNPDSIVVMGFSAGACVAGLLATQWNKPGLADKLEIPEKGNKPNAVVLGYGPGKIMKKHDIVTRNISSVGAIMNNPPPEMEISKYVDTHSPPAFIWHTRYDPLVPSTNALALAEAYEAKNLPYELHIYQKGTHGLSVNNDLSDYKAGGNIRPVNVGSWVGLCSQWIKELFGI